jgi:glycosyltransferase involved in cell wall biosynthesis
MRNILWLTSWYPNKLAPFDGDFIQRHAQAVALLHQVDVLFIINDVHGKVTDRVKEEVSKSGNLSEKIIYYHNRRTGIRFLDKLLSSLKYIQLYKKSVNKYISENGKPSFVHLHVAMKAGIIALWLKRKYAIPYILSEHWTDYLPEAIPNFEKRNHVFKNLCYKIFQEASLVSVVSKVLGDVIREKFSVDYNVIPNVVNTAIFFPDGEAHNQKVNFIHISSLAYQKNIDQVIQALAIVKEKNYDFLLTIVGPADDKLKQVIKSYGLSANIVFKKEVPQSMLAELVRRSDALILYSKYETFGCVVIEANACGKPAILSDLPVFREYSIEGETAIFANPNDPGALASTIIEFIQNKNSFDPVRISTYVESKFSYTKVANQFNSIYQQINESQLIANPK